MRRATTTTTTLRGTTSLGTGCSTSISPPVERGNQTVPILFHQKVELGLVGQHHVGRQRRRRQPAYTRAGTKVDHPDARHPRMVGRRPPLVQIFGKHVRRRPDRRARPEASDLALLQLAKLQVHAAHLQRVRVCVRVSLAPLERRHHALHLEAGAAGASVNGG